MNVLSVPSFIPVLQRLRTETRPHHDAIETSLDLMSDTLTLGAYRHTLARFHGFYRPLEASMQAMGGWADPLAVARCDQNEVVEAAKDTFLKLHRWVETGKNHQ